MGYRTVLVLVLALTGCIENQTRGQDDPEADSGADQGVVDGGQTEIGRASRTPAPDPLANDAGIDPDTGSDPDGAVPDPDGSIPEVPCELIMNPCPDGFNEIEFCPEVDANCIQIRFCESVLACGVDMDCDDEPVCPVDTHRVQRCEPDDPECTVFYDCGQLNFCLAGDACGDWVRGGPGVCGAHDRLCRTERDAAGAYKCIEPECAITSVEQGGCPPVDNIRNCYPNEAACGPVDWCGSAYAGCTVEEELNCDAEPTCQPGTHPIGGQGVCLDGDSTCTTVVACGSALACFDDLCLGDLEQVACGRTFEGFRNADRDEREQCAAGQRNDCQAVVRCNERTVCVPR